MTQIISQGLSIPANVTAGGTIQPTDVSTLYDAMNNFSIPDAIASLFQNVSSTDAAQTITGGTSTSPVTLDTTISASATKTVIHWGAYNWSSTGAALQFSYRQNGSAIAAPGTISTTTSGSGLFFVIHGPHNGSATRPVVGWQTGSTGNVLTFTANADLSTGTWSSIGLGVLFGTSTIGSTSSTVTLQYQRVIRET